MIKLPLYLDNHATTPTDPQVLEAMLPYFTVKFGNAASKTHEFGWQASRAVERARGQVAELVGAHPQEIIFTSGATESNNLALRGVMEKCREKGNHLITCATEHSSVLDVCRYLEGHGFKLTYLSVDRFGRISLDELKKAITNQTVLVSLMAANNEIGTLQPLAEIGKITKERGILFHTDAAQAAGKIPLNVHATPLDLVSLSSHKVYGPKGVGALYVRLQHPPVSLEPLVHGGGHERGFRSGTLNVPGIVGMGKAFELAGQVRIQESARLQRLRDKLWQEIFANLDEVVLNGHPIERLPHNLNVSFRFIRADALIMELKDIALSSGSACTSANPGPSHVLKALGLEKDCILASLRFGLGRFTTEEEIDYAAERVVEAVRKLRKNSVEYHMHQENIS